MSASTDEERAAGRERVRRHRMRLAGDYVEPKPWDGQARFLGALVFHRTYRGIPVCGGGRGKERLSTSVDESKHRLCLSCAVQTGAPS